MARRTSYIHFFGRLSSDLDACNILHNMDLYTRCLQNPFYYRKIPGKSSVSNDDLWYRLLTETPEGERRAEFHESRTLTDGGRILPIEIFFRSGVINFTVITGTTLQDSNSIQPQSTSSFRFGIRTNPDRNQSRTQVGMCREKVHHVAAIY